MIERQQDMEVLCACFIMSVSIKDRTVISTFVEIEGSFHIAGRISRSNREAE